MKKLYVSAEIDFCEFSFCDVITNSPPLSGTIGIDDDKPSIGGDKISIGFDD